MLELLKPEPLFDIQEYGECPAEALRVYPGADWASRDDRYLTYLTSRLQAGQHRPEAVLVCDTAFGLEVFRHAADLRALLGSDSGATIAYQRVQCTEAELALLIVREFAASTIYNRIDLAAIFADLLSAHQWTHQQLGTALGLSGHTITNTLRLAKLDPRVKDMVRRNKLNVAQAKALLTVPQDTQYKLASESILKQWTLKRLTKEVSGDMGALEPAATPAPGELPAAENPYLMAAQKAVEENLPYPADISEQASGGLCLEIQFHSLAELSGIADWMERQVGAGPGFSGSATIGPLTRDQFDEFFAAMVDDF